MQDESPERWLRQHSELACLIFTSCNLKVRTLFPKKGFDLAKLLSLLSAHSPPSLKR